LWLVYWPSCRLDCQEGVVKSLSRKERCFSSSKYVNWFCPIHRSLLYEGYWGRCPWGKNCRFVKLNVCQMNQPILRLEKDGQWQKILCCITKCVFYYPHRGRVESLKNVGLHCVRWKFIEGSVRNFVTKIKLELPLSKKCGRRKTSISATLSTTNHTSYVREPNSVLRGEKPETSHLRDFFIHGQGLLIIETSRSQWDTPQSVGLLWTSDQPDADSPIWQHTTITRDTPPFHQRDSNPKSQLTNGSRHERYH